MIAVVRPDHLDLVQLEIPGPIERRTFDGHRSP